MTKNKKGAEHVDWAISIGIFILFLLSILVYIKPVYKPTYEAETLGEMVKNSFLSENNATIYKLPLKVSSCITTGCDHTKFNINDLKDNVLIMSNDVIITNYERGTSSISFGTNDAVYWLYHSDSSELPNNGGTLNPIGNECECPNNKKGEVSEYTGLKSITSVTSFSNPTGFPDSKQFNVKIREAN
ncbi:MAG: hypothetical protein AABY07_05585, partial [Nanoarchaeota archaeon]